MLVGLAVVWPGSIGRWRGRLFLCWSAHLARAVEADRQRVRLYDELHAHPVGTDLGEVLEQLLLSRRLGLVLVGAVGQLLGLVEVGMEGAEVGARQPDSLGALEGRLEDAALLDRLPFARWKVEGLWLAQCGQRRAVDQLEGQRLSRGQRRALSNGRRGRRVFDGEAGPLALQGGFGGFGGLVVGRVGGSRGGVFAGARPRRPSGLRHVVCGSGSGSWPWPWCRAQGCCCCC